MVSFNTKRQCGGPGFHTDVKMAPADAGIDTRNDKPQASAGVMKASLEEIAMYRETLRARAKRAAGGQAAEPGTAEEYMPSNSLSSFLADAEIFGFYNFKTKVLPRAWCTEFNQFLQANIHVIQSGILDYADLPNNWLDKRDKKDPLPGIGTDPEDSSGRMLEALAQSEYRLVLNAEDQIPSNYYFWLSVFDALKLVDKYKKITVRKK